MIAADFPLRWGRGRSSPPLVVTPTGCWLWQGKRDKHGYGRLMRDGRDWLAHRWAYEHFIGPIGPLVIDHLCRNHACVNPEHLEPVTDAANLRRGAGTKINPAQVAEIRALWERWQGSQRSFAATAADSYAVAESTIRNLLGGFTWAEPKVRDAA